MEGTLRSHGALTLGCTLTPEQGEKTPRKAGGSSHCGSAEPIDPWQSVCSVISTNVGMSW